MLQHNDIVQSGIDNEGYSIGPRLDWVVPLSEASEVDWP